MNRLAASRLSVVLATMATVLLIACGGSSNSGSTVTPLNLAGTWTVTTVSTQGRGTFSGTASLTQTGQGLGVNGSTTLDATVGEIAVSQNGSTLTGSLRNTVRPTAITYNFTGTLTSGTLTVTGSSPCSSTGSQVLTITGTLAAASAQGSYTIKQGSGCFYTGDAGTFTATKK